MSLMKEWDESPSTTTTTSTSNQSNLPYKYIEPKGSLSKETEKSIGHPVSKFAKIMIIALAISLPTISFIFAARVKGRLSLPFYIFGLPSWLILVPILIYFYRKKGFSPFIRSKGVTALMAVSFSFYSLYTILFSMYILRPFFQPVYNENSEKVDTKYSSMVWLPLIPLVYLHLCVYIQHLVLSKCRMRPTTYLYLVSYPSSVFFTTMILSIPFYLFVSFIPPIVGVFMMLIPFILSLLGLYQTLITRPPNKWEVKDIYLRTSSNEEMENEQLITPKKMLKRVKIQPLSNHNEQIVDFKQPLSIIQIADPHLGPMMSCERLTEICESTVKLNPDLVLLTGDFFTSESFNPENTLEIALAPLKKLPPGKVFACVGNHDLEEGCMEILERALESIECPLLIDKCVLVETRIGKVQITGFDYRNKARQEHIMEVCNAYPPIQGVPRIALLHDPGSFKFIPTDYGCITFSGHTHGGQIGIRSDLFSLTMVGITGMPDYSLWRNGNNYLYVHTGQGCRSMLGTMVLRVGAPAEDSLLQVYFES
ncbi:hypothetical protein RB653_001203 [Dictyostelium firmibasis]|uniref:Calcineurin-like phosphoesterase domain-containing protein n=1 Tax=Dictyostelium firmibasis TaxID=79012 RepID=A0AAN7U706_9MYCE